MPAAPVAGHGSEALGGPDRRLPGPPPARPTLAVSLDIPPAASARLQAPDSPRGFGHRLSCRRLSRYRRFRAPSPTARLPRCPLGPGWGGRDHTSYNQSASRDRRRAGPFTNNHEEVKLRDRLLWGGDCSNRQNTRPMAGKRRQSTIPKSQSAVSCLRSLPRTHPARRYYESPSVRNVTV